MKTKETKTKSIRVLLLVMAALLYVPLQAQKLIKKELQTENETEDGFQYQWNKYTYILGKDTLDAAFDMNGKRITPNGYRKYEKGKAYPGVRYTGGGRFQVYSKNTDAFGNRLISGYNVKGECVLPETHFTFMSYLGHGFFALSTRNELGKEVSGVYDYKGNCIIPESKGFKDFLKEEDFVECITNINGNIYAALYDFNGNCIIPETEGFWYYSKRNGFIFCNRRNDTRAVYDSNGNCIISEELRYSSISYYPEYEFFWCEKEGVKYTVSKDGMYYAEGYYFAKERDEFERKKRRVPIRKSSSSYASNRTSSSNNSYASYGNVGHTLLYKGAYWICGANGDVDGMIEIYSDCIVLAGLSTIPFKSFRGDGERIYSTGDGPIFVVDSYYNIRRENSLYDCTFRKKGNDVGGSYNNGGGTSNSSGSTQQSHGTREVTITCPVCHSTGNCQTCLGRGWRTLNDNSTQKCPTCNGNKVCWKCNGTGKITKTERY